jgi:hypothetical protein
MQWQERRKYRWCEGGGHVRRKYRWCEGGGHVRRLFGFFF